MGLVRAHCHLLGIRLTQGNMHGLTVFIPKESFSGIEFG